MSYIENVEEENNVYKVTIEGEIYELPKNRVNELVELEMPLEEVQELMAYLKYKVKNYIEYLIEEEYEQKKIIELKAIDSSFDFELIANLIKKLLTKYPSDTIRGFITLLKPNEIVQFLMVGKLAQEEVISAQFTTKADSIYEYGELVQDGKFETLGFEYPIYTDLDQGIDGFHEINEKSIERHTR